ncbi:hypothetical protein FGS76_16240 [Alloalcanivorax gelatiniphagus]|uniref:Curli production assembly/transport component CsgG n=2 Tax=Alloalcanivorax gelatiniphagus TaxID=1194167 RepID=A0ABY2XGR2_9GAMM|nr:hypothetical protein FGS76_16240 [Alloalcanivorax gelatiniphagus]
MKKMLGNKVVPVMTLIALVSGCAVSGGTPAPTYNANGSAAGQANSFIDAANEKHMKGVNKVGVLSCNVMFGMTSAASASTSGGFRAGADRATGTISRSDVKVTVTYTVDGVQESELQRIADQACADAEQQLADAGFQVVPLSTLKANGNYQAIQKGGRSSPFEYKEKRSGTRYLVLARSGDTVTDTRYTGAAQGFAQSFKAVTGDGTAQLESQLIKDLGMTGVNINLLVDFASLESDGHKTFAGLANKNSAKVKADIQLAVSGDLRFQPIGEQKCWKEYGKEKCMIKSNHQPVFATRQAVSSDKRFYRSIEDATTTGDKITSGLTKAVGMLSALSGTSSKVARDITRYQVNVIPEVYDAEAVTLSRGLSGMAAAKAASSR